MFRKKDEKGPQPMVVDPDVMHPSSSAEYIHRGWQYYALKQFDQAANDFSEALRLSSDDTDALYALGLAYKSNGQGEKAVQAFQQFLDHIEAIEDPIRASMLRRLTQAHINDINTGDWNLEKEIWQRRK